MLVGALVDAELKETSVFISLFPNPDPKTLMVDAGIVAVLASPEKRKIVQTSHY